MSELPLYNNTPKQNAERALQPAQVVSTAKIPGIILRYNAK